MRTGALYSLYYNRKKCGGTWRPYRHEREGRRNPVFTGAFTGHPGWTSRLDIPAGHPGWTSRLDIPAETLLAKRLLAETGRVMMMMLRVLQPEERKKERKNEEEPPGPPASDTPPHVINLPFTFLRIRQSIT
jgi:hypothetical protein